jgi:hypothetical protein
MSKNVVNIKVDLKSDGNPPDFDLVPTPPLPKWKNAKNDFVFENNGADGFVLNFKLQGTALGYRFPDVEDEALYSAPGTGCPTCEGQWDQFEAEDVEDHNKTLVVRNRNECEAEFGYTLRVKKTLPDGKIKWLELDPGGLNKNGSVQVTGVAQTIAIAAGAAAAAVLAVISFGLLKRRSDRGSR